MRLQKFNTKIFIINFLVFLCITYFIIIVSLYLVYLCIQENKLRKLFLILIILLIPVIALYSKDATGTKKTTDAPQDKPAEINLKNLKTDELISMLSTIEKKYNDEIRQLQDQIQLLRKKIKLLRNQKYLSTSEIKKILINDRKLVFRKFKKVKYSYRWVPKKKKSRYIKKKSVKRNVRKPKKQ